MSYIYFFVSLQLCKVNTKNDNYEKLRWNMSVIHNNSTTPILRTSWELECGSVRARDPV